MKTSCRAFLIILLLGAMCVAAKDAPAQEAPRFKARVVCFNGKIDSHSSCAGTNFQPDGTIHPSGKMTCGFPGKVSEIEWSFLKRQGNKDVYRFTRRFPADVGTPSTSTKEVKFRKVRVVVFQDKFQVVVIEPPQS